MSKQTAVEWLVEQVFGKHTYVWNDVIEKAKAMEREQMGLPNCKQIDGISSITIIDPATGKVLGKRVEP